MLAGTEALQAQMFEEMKGRIKEDDASVPTPDGAVRVLQPLRDRRAASAPSAPAARRRRRRGGAAGRGGARPRATPTTRVGAAEHSPDHALYAWAEDAQGSEYYRIQVARPGHAARCCRASIENAYGDFAFSPDGAWLFWIWRDENARPSKVFRRPARGGEDALIYEEPDEGMFLGVGVTADRSHILIRRQQPGDQRESG